MPESSVRPMGQRVLGRSGIRVSELCLGTMTFGTAWAGGADETTCAGIYRAFREAGGTFIDTANLYTSGQSEAILGRLMAGEREALVVGTKFGLSTGAEDANSAGGHRKNLRRSVEASLHRLQTDHLDLMWLHAWDQRTPVEETLRALDDLVRAGKVLALGVSNTPAWVVARSEAIAELRGWTSFCALQVQYSLAARSPERELLPMARALGLAVSAWSPLARGLLAGKEPTSPRGDGPSPGARAREVVVEVAAELGTTPACLALAWLLRQGVTPVLGATRVAQLSDNLGALELALEDGHLERLDQATRPELGYPHDFLRERHGYLAAGPPRAR